MSTTTQVALPSTGLWQIAPDYSTVSFTIRHHGWATFRGGFARIGGSFDADAGKLVGEGAVADVLTGLERLRTQILTPEWFDPGVFPIMSFVSTELSVADGGLSVDGKLTLHGLTRPVVASGTWQGPGPVIHHDGHVTQRLGIDLEAIIDRRDFGLTFNAQIGEGLLNLGWEVKIEANLQLVLS